MQYEKIYLKEGRPDVYLETYISDSLPNVTRKAILVIPGGGYFLCYSIGCAACIFRAIRVPPTAILRDQE